MYDGKIFAQGTGTIVAGSSSVKDLQDCRVGNGTVRIGLVPGYRFSRSGLPTAISLCRCVHFCMQQAVFQTAKFTTESSMEINMPLVQSTEEGKGTTGDLLSFSRKAFL